MTKKTATETANAAATSYYEQVKQTLENVQGKIEIPAAAREFVQKAAVTTKDRAESVHAGVNSAATSAEKLTTAFIGGYANFVRGVVDATFANVRHSLETVEKVAAAKSLNEAVQVQADYVRESAQANFERVKDVAGAAREAVSAGTATVQEEFRKLNPYAKAA